jgi:Asparaginase, N-terminal
MRGAITVLGMGGIISTTPAADGRQPWRGAAERIQALGADVPGSRIAARDGATTHGSAVGPVRVWELAQAIHEEGRHGAAGVVVTHGTDTLEETAYGLSLLLHHDVPVVLTGAMRGIDVRGSDGPANLTAALTTAADPRIAALGRWSPSRTKSTVRVGSARFTRPGFRPSRHLLPARSHTSPKAAYTWFRHLLPRAILCRSPRDPQRGLNRSGRSPAASASWSIFSPTSRTASW